MMAIYALGSSRENQSTSFLSRNSHVRMGRPILDMSHLIDSNVNLFLYLIDEFGNKKFGVWIGPDKNLK